MYLHRKNISVSEIIVNNFILRGGNLDELTIDNC